MMLVNGDMSYSPRDSSAKRSNLTQVVGDGSRRKDPAATRDGGGSESEEWPGMLKKRVSHDGS